MTTKEQKERCPDRLYKDSRDHPREWYLKIQNELEEKINKLVEEIEYEHCVAFTIEQQEKYPGRVTAYLMNKDMRNIMRDL